MFNYLEEDYLDLIHLQKAIINEEKQKLTYYWDGGRIESLVLADADEFNAKADEIKAISLNIDEFWYNLDRIGIVRPNGRKCWIYFFGGKQIDKIFDTEDEVQAIIDVVDPTFIEINETWYNGKNLYIVRSNRALLWIEYEWLGRERMGVYYEDEAAFDAAIEKITSLGGSGGGGSMTAKPKFSVPGGTVDPGTSVEITCATEGATIHYTTDGTTPTLDSPTYSSAITVSRTMTIKAIAVKLGLATSKVASVNYTVETAQCAKPVFTPAAGEVDPGTEVTITCATPGAVIHYTDDGTVPDASSPVYDGTPISITATVTFKAFAMATDMADSDVVTAKYTLKMYRYAGMYNEVPNAAHDDYEEEYVIKLSNIDTIITGLDWFETNIYNAKADAKLEANTKSLGTPTNEWSFGANADAEVGYQEVYAYPKSLGSITQITNNSFDATGSFDQHEMTFDGVVYNVIFLRLPVGAPGDTQKLSFN